MGGPQKRKREEKGGGAARRGREGKEGAQEISKGNEADNQATVDKLHKSTDCPPLLLSVEVTMMSQCTIALGRISWGVCWDSRTPGTARRHTRRCHSTLSGGNTD